MAQQPETIISWQAPEFRHYPKNPAWFITLGLLLALLVAYQIFQKDWFGAICSVIIVSILVAFAVHKPKISDIQISTHGVHIDELLIPYTHIKQFWVVDNEQHKTLNLETSAYLNNLLAIELSEQDPEEVREILVEILPENPEPTENLAQRIAHKLKF